MKTGKITTTVNDRTGDLHLYQKIPELQDHS